jgi:hypothetical protein
VDIPASSVGPSPHAGGEGATGTGLASGAGAAELVVGGGAVDAAGFPVAGEQASTNPDSAASAHKARGKAMGPMLALVAAEPELDAVLRWRLTLANKEVTRRSQG